MTDSSGGDAVGARVAWGVAGIIVGALFSALLLKTVESRREGPAGGSAGGAENASASSGSANSENLRAELAAAQKEAETLRAEVETLRRKAEDAARSAGPAGGASSKVKSWRELAASLWRVREKVRGKKWDDWPADCKDLQLEMFAAVTDLSRRLGLPFDEALMSPEGLTRLLVDLLEQSEPPPSAEEKARLEALVAGTEGSWKEYLGAREELSALELRLVRMETMKKTMGAVLAGLTPEQAEIAKAYEIFENHEDSGPQTWIEGSREKVTKELSANWVKTLQLDPIQETAIRPVVDDYIAKAMELNQGFWKRRQEGEEVPWPQQWRAQADLMIATQKKLAETARLTEEQAKAMKEWGEVYGVNIYEPPPPKNE
ncbi:MAG: hypothetical protein HYY18_03570 [Planctomycetes bacterium]|nr:hypothetical protein [Planctomycetota bacterium]